MRIFALFNLSFLILVAGNALALEEAPQGFSLQVLEPTGGKILKPEGWVYKEAHRGGTFTWTIQKEDRPDGTYDTGVKIQTFMEIEEAIAKKPKEFIMDFINQKKKEAEKVFDECPESEQGMFTRVCLETQEGEYRILYSCFWGNDMDLAVVSIAGAKLADWDEYAGIFEKMSRFELIDMSRFQE